jgi:hypothetical protein
VGQFAYYLYVAACTAVILAASVPPDSGSRLNPWIVLKNAGRLIVDALTLHFGPLRRSAERLLVDPGLVLTLLAAFGFAAMFASYVAQTRRIAFSRFWHDSRHDLREALKSARKSMQEKPAPRPPAEAAGA